MFCLRQNYYLEWAVDKVWAVHLLCWGGGMCRYTGNK